jgi:hypothetical protein
MIYEVIPGNVKVTWEEKKSCMENKSSPLQGVQILQEPPKNLGIIKMTRSKLHSEDPQISGATIQKIVTWVILHLGFTYPCISVS